MEPGCLQSAAAVAVHALDLRIPTGAQHTCPGARIRGSARWRAAYHAPAPGPACRRIVPPYLAGGLLAGGLSGTHSVPFHSV